MDLKLYTTHCPKCEVLKKKLDSAGINYTVCDDEIEMVKLGFLSAPMLQVDKEVLDFKAAIDWVNERSKKK